MNLCLKKYILMFCSILLLNACSIPTFHKASDKKENKTNQIRSNINATVSSQSSLPARNYIEKKGILFDGITIASSNNECVDRFNFLKEANSGEYQQYSNAYNKISRDYTFLNINKNIMDKDSYVRKFNFLAFKA